MNGSILRTNSRRLALIPMLVIASISICLSGCNGGLASAKIVTTQKTKVIIPEKVPEDLLEVPPCEEKDEIKWGDARDASDHYRRCSDLRGSRIETLATTIKGRWDWLEKEAKKIDQENKDLEAEADKLFKPD